MYVCVVSLCVLQINCSNVYTYSNIIMSGGCSFLQLCMLGYVLSNCETFNLEVVVDVSNVQSPSLWGACC